MEIERVDSPLNESPRRSPKVVMFSDDVAVYPLPLHDFRQPTRTQRIWGAIYEFFHGIYMRFENFFYRNVETRPPVVRSDEVNPGAPHRAPLLTMEDMMGDGSAPRRKEGVRYLAAPPIVV